jgi:hypothetical protein
MSIFKRKYEWPEAAEPSGGFAGGCNINGTQYKVVKVSDGRWEYVVDHEAEEYLRQAESHRAALYWALQSRLLTDEESKEVERYGDSLNTPIGVSYSSTEKKSELQNALYNQARLKILALQSK